MEALTLFAISLGGGLVPLFLRWTDRALHTALALSTGIFLGAVFLHLLPSVAQLSFEEPAAMVGHEHDGHGHDEHAGYAHDGEHAHEDDGHAHDAVGHVGHAHGDPLPWIFVLVGVLAVYLIESLLLPHHDHDHNHGHSHAPDRHDHQSDLSRHRAVGYAALVGLIIHAFTAGVSLSAAGMDHAIGPAIFLAICAHKGFEGFSLATVFLLAEQSRARIVLMLVAFSVVTPAGMLLGHSLMDVLDSRGIGIAAALAAGTFLYVSLCELLPEVFHRREAIAMRSLLLVLGIVLMGWFGEAGV